ncbi:hypothetical protein MMC2321_04066 [Chitinophaga sp. MM2321]
MVLLLVIPTLLNLVFGNPKAYIYKHPLKVKAIQKNPFVHFIQSGLLLSCAFIPLKEGVSAIAAARKNTGSGCIFRYAQKNSGITTGAKQPEITGLYPPEGRHQ